MDARLTIVLAVLGALVIISVVAMVRYKAETFLKIFGVLGPILGSLVGGIVIYYFQQDVIEKAKDQTVECGTTLAGIEAAQGELGRQLNVLEAAVQRAGSSGTGEARAIFQGIQTLKQATVDQQQTAASALGRLPPDLRKRIRPDRQ